MLIIDNRKTIPLDTSRLDWGAECIKNLDDENIAIPLHDPALNDTVEFFAFEIAARQPWAWPDVTKTSVALQVDTSRSYFRFSLLVGAVPNETFDENCPPEWVEFEAKRKQAVQENAGQAAYDSFPVMLTPTEESNVRSALYELGVY